MIKKKKFLEKNTVEEMNELLGEDLDMEAEFNKLDSENNEKVQQCHFHLFLMFPQVVFSDIIGWAFKKAISRNMAAKK